MKYQAPFPTKYRLLRLLRPVVTKLGKFYGSDVGWQHRRLSGTAAVRDIPNADRSRKRLSREERKAKVEAYVNQYRVVNAGKFPTAFDAMKQVGGSYYIVRDILQELEYNSNLPTMASIAENSKLEQTGGSSSQGEVGDSSHQKMVGMSTLTKNQEISAADVSETQIMADLKLERASETTPVVNADIGENNISLEGREANGLPCSLENITAEKTITSLEDSNFRAKTNHPFEVPGTCRKTKLGEINEASPLASEPNQFKRESTTEKTQDNELQESSLWGNLKSFASNIISMWRKA